MTIIVIKNGVVAWDSLVTSGTMRWGNIKDKMILVTKNKRDYVVGGCGELHEIQQWQRTIIDMDDDDFKEWLLYPVMDRITKSSPVMYDPRKKMIWEGIGKVFTMLPINGINYASGTGEQYAYGLMDAGKDAITTVEMVCKKFDCCGPPIYSIDTRRKV